MTRHDNNRKKNESPKLKRQRGEREAGLCGRPVVQVWMWGGVELVEAIDKKTFLRNLPKREQNTKLRSRMAEHVFMRV
jgi:hypothetical protein